MSDSDGLLDSAFTESLNDSIFTFSITGLIVGQEETNKKIKNFVNSYKDAFCNSVLCKKKYLLQLHNLFMYKDQ